jgi:hypothetical protein
MMAPNRGDRSTRERTDRADSRHRDRTGAPDRRSRPGRCDRRSGKVATVTGSSSTLKNTPYGKSRSRARRARGPISGNWNGFSRVNVARLSWCGSRAGTRRRGAGALTSMRGCRRFRRHRRSGSCAPRSDRTHVRPGNELRRNVVWRRGRRRATRGSVWRDRMARARPRTRCT